jgi:DNA-binding MarR family transcriptional regulator
MDPLERETRRELEILTAIDGGHAPSQRVLAERLGVALGLTNLYLKRLVRKGYVKISEFPRKPLARKRLRYLLTPKGIAEKTRLTYEYMDRSLSLYRLARETLRDALSHLPQNGLKRIALYGTGEAAELAYLTLKEFGLEPVGIFARDPGETFLGMPVRDYRDLAIAEVDAIILATFDKPKLHVPELTALGIPAEKLLTLYPLKKSNGSR